jgi:hypothetical protein
MRFGLRFPYERSSICLAMLEVANLLYWNGHDCLIWSPRPPETVDSFWDSRVVHRVSWERWTELTRYDGLVIADMPDHHALFAAASCAETTVAVCLPELGGQLRSLEAANAIVCPSSESLRLCQGARLAQSVYVPWAVKTPLLDRPATEARTLRTVWPLGRDLARSSLPPYLLLAAFFNEKPDAQATVLLPDGVPLEAAPHWDVRVEYVSAYNREWLLSSLAQADYTIWPVLPDHTMYTPLQSLAVGTPVVAASTSDLVFLTQHDADCRHVPSVMEGWLAAFRALRPGASALAYRAVAGFNRAHRFEEGWLEVLKVAETVDS